MVESLEQRTLLSVVADSIAAASQQQTLSGLPAAAQQAVSAAIGRDEPAYHAASVAAGVTLANPANGFTARVQTGALQVAAGADTWDLALTGLGYGGAVQPLGTAQTSASGNRVDSNYGPIDEWYVNGPGGLEQGFTVAPLPQPGADGPLTLQLSSGGDLTGTVNASGDGLTLTRPGGSAALGYSGLVAYDAAGTSLPAWLEVRSDGGHQDLLINVNTAGAEGPITIDPLLQEAKLTASDGGANSFFGFAVSMSGNTLVIGAPGVANNQGAAYVFTESGSAWTQTTKLTASDGAANDNFGKSVSISGNTVVVGSPEAAISGKNYQGAVYAFTGSGSAWVQAAKLTASDGVLGDELGVSVSMSGNTVVAGAAVRHGRREPWPGSGLRVHRAHLRLGKHDPDRQAHRLRRRGGRLVRLFGIDQR